MRHLIVCTLATFTYLAGALPCDAQRLRNSFAPTLLPQSILIARGTVAPGGGTALLIETAGGIAGSLAGFGLVYSTSSDCESEDLVCNLRHAGTAALVATVGAGSGVYLAGLLGNTQPSALGAVLGAVAGLGAGIGVSHLLTEELNVVNSDAAAIVSYGVTQGTVAALGSRIARALK